ncbi:MAG: hypothetical protein ACUVV5_02380 [Candidatus Aminicenantales bacterium]
MPQKNWKENLRACFENIEILERCKAETSENFKQFCEFIAEPAFEALVEELKGYDVKARFGTSTGRSTWLKCNFPGSRIDHFYYIISLPRNSIELRLRLHIKGRKTPRSPLIEEERAFFEELPPAKIMKLSKEDLIDNIIEHYRDFNLRALTAPD